MVCGLATNVTICGMFAGATITVTGAVTLLAIGAGGGQGVGGGLSRRHRGAAVRSHAAYAADADLSGAGGGPAQGAGRLTRSDADRVGFEADDLRVARTGAAPTVTVGRSGDRTGRRRWRSRCRWWSRSESPRRNRSCASHRADARADGDRGGILDYPREGRVLAGLDAGRVSA